MVEAGKPEPPALQSWIGRTEIARDELTARLAWELSATLDESADQHVGAQALIGIHWCLAPPCARAACIGPDGHPMPGGFLPPIPLPRRMWAGSRLKFHDRLLIGDKVERRTRIVDIAAKQGRTGDLYFVSLDHEITTARGLAIEERQDIVYLGAASAPAATSGKPMPPTERKRIHADTVLLFRYSALTFNSHRIHYDRPYAINVEGYPGLVVHGPLQATLLLNFAANIWGAPPRSFDFRAVQPLFDFEAFEICARETASGMDLWVQAEDGRSTMNARAAR